MCVLAVLIAQHAKIHPRNLRRRALKSKWKQMMQNIILENKVIFYNNMVQHYFCRNLKTRAFPVQASVQSSCFLRKSCCSRNTHCSEMWPELQSKKRPSWVRTQWQGAGRACSAQLWELCKQQGQILRKRGKGGVGGWDWVTFCGSNHGGEVKSRPLRRQPVREQWEGVQTAQAVLFIKHTPPN